MTMVTAGNVNQRYTQTEHWAQGSMGITVFADYRVLVYTFLTQTA